MFNLQPFNLGTHSPCYNLAVEWVPAARRAPLFVSTRAIYTEAEKGSSLPTIEEKAKTISEFATHEGDVGSTSVQIALLTRRIAELTGHLREHKHDFHSRRGLLVLVGRRRRLQRYLARNDPERYQQTLAQLGLRK
jgi:small subunit ribosomal protein S15